MRATLTSSGMVLVFASGCNAQTEKSASTSIAVVKESPSEGNLRTEVFNDAIVSGQRQRVIVTTNGNGTPEHPIGLDIDWGKAEVAESEPNDGQILSDKERVVMTKDADGVDRIGVFFESGSPTR